MDIENAHSSKRDAACASALPLEGDKALPVRLVLFGAPRTKKTSNRVLRFGKRNKIVPSAPYLRWRNQVVPQLRQAWAGRAPIAFPVNVAAVFYRDAARGDLCGFLQGLFDILEEARVVDNDKWIVSCDGSRLRKDLRARVELEISNAN